MESEPPQRWAATYTKQVKQKRKAYQDGALLLYPASGRLVLLDDAGDTLESRFLRSSEEISSGAALSFQAHLVDVGEPEDGPARYTSSSASASAAAGSRSARRGGGARARPPSSGRVFPLRVPRTFVNPSKSHGCGDGGEGEAAGSGSGRADVAESKFQEWTALYTAQLTQKAKKYHDGLVRLVQIGPQVKQIVLLDEDAQVLCSRHLKSGESVESGKKCHFPNYLVDICEAKNQNKEHTSEESMVHTKPRNGKSTSNKMGMGALSKSQKFISPHKFHDLENTVSQVTASSGKPETDNTEAVSADQPGSLIEADSDFKEWNALYTTQLTQKAKKYHDGIIRLMQIGSHARQIVLLDEYGEELCSRYIKSVESVESGKRFQMPNYLIDVCEFRNQKNDIQRATATNPCPAFGKLSSTRDLPQFHDLQDGKSGCPRSFDRREVGKSTFGNMDHSVRTASQILSIMKPPAEVRISQSAPSGQAHSLASSVSRAAFDVNCRKNSVVDDSNRSFGGRETSGSSHFATQLRSSIQSCLNLETLPRKNSIGDHQWNESSGNNYSTYDDPNIRRPAAFEGQNLAMVDTLASNVSNAKGQKLDSSNQHSGSSSDTVPVMNIVTDTGFQDGRSGTADQLTTQNSSTDGIFDDPPSTSAYTLTCKDPKIQALIHDCPSFDLGF